MVANVEDSSPYLNAIDFLNGDKVADAAFEDLDVDSSWIEGLWISQGYGWS